MPIKIAGIKGAKQFKLNLAKATKASEKVARSALTELFSSIVISTPVDTGRLRGNWQISDNFGTGCFKKM